MNAKRREKLKDAISMLSNAATIVENICDKEEDYVDNYPENLQGTERFEKMEDAVDNLSDALEKIDEAKEQITLAIR